jgi:hypothetical protein
MAHLLKKAQGSPFDDAPDDGLTIDLYQAAGVAHATFAAGVQFHLISRRAGRQNS